MYFRSLKIFFFLAVFANLLQAQELYLCESYTEDGLPVGPLNQLEIKPYGTAFYILLDNQKEFDDPLLYLFVDKLIDGKFTPFESKTISIKNDDTWAVTSFEFKEQGIYEVYFLNSSQSRLATNKVEARFSEEFTNPTSVPTRTSLNDGQFVFCELVINGKPVNPFNNLSLSRTGGQTFIYLNNYAPFGIEKIKIQLWKQSNTDSSYEQLVDSKKYKILPEWKDTFFKYIFAETGKYKIDILDSTDSFISSNTLTVTK